MGTRLQRQSMGIDSPRWSGTRWVANPTTASTSTSKSVHGRTLKDPRAPRTTRQSRVHPPRSRHVQEPATRTTGAFAGFARRSQQPSRPGRSIVRWMRPTMQQQLAHRRGAPPAMQGTMQSPKSQQRIGGPPRPRLGPQSCMHELPKELRSDAEQREDPIWRPMEHA